MGDFPGNQSCSYDDGFNSKQLWNEPPLIGPLPALVRQITLTTGSNLIFLFILQPFIQPRIVRDLISALVVSPFILNQINKSWSSKLWPEKGTTNLETLANMGLAYAMFIKGLQMDFTPLTNRQNKTDLALVSAIIPLPFAIGVGIYYFFIQIDEKPDPGCLYWGVILASAGFDSLTSILSKLKLLCTDTGREMLSAGMINDLFSWISVMFTISLSALPFYGESSSHGPNAFLPCLTVTAFITGFGGIGYLLIRPLITYLIKRKDGRENFGESVVNLMLYMVLGCGFMSEMFGAYSIVGAFVFGLSIPHGYLASVLLDKVDHWVKGILLPLFMVTIGVKMNLSAALQNSGLVVILIASIVAKPLCAFLTACVCRANLVRAIVFGVLMSAKGLAPLIIANIGFDRGHLSEEAFTILVLVIMITTIPVGPITAVIYNWVLKNSKPHDLRTIQDSQPGEDFRVIATVHDTRNIPGVINLLELSNISDISTMSLFALHLVELIGRHTTLLISHDHLTTSSPTSKSFSGEVSNHSVGGVYNSNQVISAFDNYRHRHTGTTSVQTYSVYSPLNTMHEDIASIAEDKQASLIILPFHIQQIGTVDWKMDESSGSRSSNALFRSVNQNLMGSSPCSIVVLVDRGIGALRLTSSRAISSFPSFTTSVHSRESWYSSQTDLSSPLLKVGMLYFGGPDDREALSFAVRLAAHPLVRLSVIRFVAGDNPVDVRQFMLSDLNDNDEDNKEDDWITTVFTQSEREKRMDEAFLGNVLRGKDIEDEGYAPIEYKEMVSNSGEETLDLLRMMDHSVFKMYVVGRGRRVLSPMTAGLAEWSDLPELGPVGDVLVTSEFLDGVSVLVVQKYVGARQIECSGNGVAESVDAGSSAAVRAPYV